MAKYLIYDTEQLALDACAKIEQRARELYSSAGYQVDETGAIIGVNVATGQSDPGAQRTERYAVPEQRLDGKWIVPHPEQMPSANVEQQGMLVKDYVAQDLTADLVEERQPDWFPPPPDPLVPPAGP
jgi:hypothetical protein